MDDEMKVLFEDEVEDVAPDLPPAGYKRDEELAQRTDTLEQKAEELAEKTERERIDPKKLQPDREIQNMLQRFDYLSVHDSQPGYSYCWVTTARGGVHVWEKKALGWKVVQGNDPENREAMIAEDTTRRIGDVILMRIEDELLAAIERANKQRQKAQEMSVKAELVEITGKYPRVFVLHDDLDNVPFGRGGDRTLGDIMEQKAMAQTAATRRGGARRVAMNQIDKHLRNGTIPGL